MRCRSNNRCMKNSQSKEPSQSEARLLSHKSNRCSYRKLNSKRTIAKCSNPKSSNKREFSSLHRLLFLTTSETSLKSRNVRLMEQQNCLGSPLKCHHDRTINQSLLATITDLLTLLSTMKRETRETKISFTNCPQQE